MNSTSERFKPYALMCFRAGKYQVLLVMVHDDSGRFVMVLSAGEEANQKKARQIQQSLVAPVLQKMRLSTGTRTVPGTDL